MPPSLEEIALGVTLKYKKINLNILQGEKLPYGTGYPDCVRRIRPEGTVPSTAEYVAIFHTSQV